MSNVISTIFNIVLEIYFCKNHKINRKWHFQNKKYRHGQTQFKIEKIEKNSNTNTNRTTTKKLER